MKIVLASKSPRRRELLAKIEPEFEIITRETDETLPSGVHPEKGVEILAIRKGEAVARELSPDVLVISSDTLVELSGVPLGKPESEADALRMLGELSGKAHNVHTGVAVHYFGYCLYIAVGGYFLVGEIVADDFFSIFLCGCINLDNSVKATGTKKGFGKVI